MLSILKTEELIDKINQKLILRLTKEMVAMDSQNPPGKTIHIAKYLQEECSKLGLDSKIYKMDDKRANIVITYGSGNRDIVLSGHLDTVPYGDAKRWKYHPLSGAEDEKNIYGRGSADMKGGVATLIGVMELLKRLDIKLTHRIVFAGTADEEVGMNGAFHLQKNNVMEKADGLIITEATSLKVGIAEKGPFWVRVKVKGKAAHGSLPEHGINAIEGACKAINEIKTILDDTEDDLLGKSTVNIGRINGGVKINVVPEECSFDCDFRLLPNVDQKEFKMKIKSLIENLNKKFPQTFNYEIIHKIPALRTKKDEPLIKSLLKWSNKLTGFPEEPIGLTYGTDAAALIPPKSIPFAIVGGGTAAIIHQTDEYIAKEELFNATKIIAAAIIDTYKKV